jgi:hypothetical protein
MIFNIFFVLVSLQIFAMPGNQNLTEAEVQLLMNEAVQQCQKEIHLRTLPQQESTIKSMVLMLAAEQGDLRTLRMLLKRKNPPNVNCSTERGLTPVMLAAKNGHLEAVELLLENGADVNRVNDKGNTVLLFAVSCKIEDRARKAKLCELILKTCNNSLAANNLGLTFFHLATRAHVGIEFSELYRMAFAYKAFSKRQMEALMNHIYEDASFQKYLRQYAMECFFSGKSNLSALQNVDPSKYSPLVKEFLSSAEAQVKALLANDSWQRNAV